MTSLIPMFYPVMFMCMLNTCDAQVVHKAMLLTECLEYIRVEKEKFKKVDDNVIASCVPSTDYE